ncbi:hypothetical protein SCUP234_07790 [Seiridium cupressi]
MTDHQNFKCMGGFATPATADTRMSRTLDMKAPRLNRADSSNEREKASGGSAPHARSPDSSAHHSQHTRQSSTRTHYEGGTPEKPPRWYTCFHDARQAISQQALSQRRLALFVDEPVHEAPISSQLVESIYGDRTEELISGFPVPCAASLTITLSIVDPKEDQKSG